MRLKLGIVTNFKYRDAVNTNVIYRSIERRDKFVIKLRLQFKMYKLHWCLIAIQNV